MKSIYLVSILLLMSSCTIAQQQSFTDPAQQYNRLLIENGNGKYYQIQNFKVVGTPYLYGGKNEGVTYGAEKNDGKINYNTYNQQVELNVGENTPPIIRDAKSVDSFFLTVNTDLYKGEIKFINANQWGIKNNYFLQEVIKTSSYTLYKRFYSTLEIVTTNYIQSELRQFQLNYEYYYIDNGKAELKKLKTSENGLKGEFSAKKSCFANFDFSTLSSDKETVLKSFFQLLDSCK